MSKITARNAYLAASYANTACINFSSDLNSITLTQERDAPEVTVFATTNRERLEGGIANWSLDFEGFYDAAILGTNTAAIDLALFTMWAASNAIVFGPSGSGATAEKYSGSGILSNYEISFGLEDAVTISGTIESMSGSIALGAFS